MMQLRMQSLTAAAVAIVSFTASAIAQDPGVHPDRRNLAVAGTVVETRRRDSSRANAVLNKMADRLRRALRADSIGTIDGPEQTVLGLITDVAVDRQRRLFVLDMAFETVRVFSSTGAPLFEFGRSGNGPLEFRSPVAIWHDEAKGTVIVVDIAHGVKEFRLDEAGRPTLLQQTQLKGSARDACSYGAGVAALVATPNRTNAASDADHMIQTLPASGEGKTFGEGYRSATSLVRYVMAEGVMDCGRNQIVASLSALPFIRAFSGDGKPLWVARLSDFVPPRMVESQASNGKLAVGLDPTVPPHNSIRKITRIGSEFYAVQVGLITRQALMDRSLYAAMETYLLDAQTGEGVYIGKHLPMLNAVVGDYAYTSETSPFPRVIRFRLP